MSVMESIPSQILNTIIMRPYFALFLLTYVLGCSLHMGAKRTALFGIVGYLVAWFSELSSIHNGIPFGYYYYIETTIDKELWIVGVPFMDSMSFVFLAWASYTVALMASSPVSFSGAGLYIYETKKIRHSSEVRLLGTLCFVLLDVIIDPVALRGDRWFLGKIYGYPEKGFYFGVPLSNFAGWLAVGYVLMWALQITDRILERRGTADWSGHRLTWRYVIGPALYFGILLFNLSITFSIKEFAPGWSGVLIVLTEISFLYFLAKENLSRGATESALSAHLADYPQAVHPERE